MQNLFRFQLVLAAAMVVTGLVAAVKPYALLDVVLTPEQLQDQEVHDSTIALMKKVQGNNHFVWLGFAATIAGTAVVGLRLTRSGTPEGR